ncbi:uncharacterized protein [Haliotis cracherodii]|uniref:uncharacterized protein n=1 Tax=Haliotis cracherodii TaxID=6455 RepID=UPI0039E83A73
MLGLLNRKQEPADKDVGAPPITPRLSWAADYPSPRPNGPRKTLGAELTNGTPPRPRHPLKAPTPVRFTVGGPWALKECEEHTTWVNETLRKAKLPLIDDLRRAVSDGITLVRLLGALERSPVPGAETDRSLTRSEVLVNLYRCLSFLADRQVDTAGLDAEDLANGDLRSTLVLLGNIRKNYDSGYGTRSEGDGGLSSPNQESDNAPWLNMPGRLTVEGGQSRGPPPPIKKDKPLPPQRRSAFGVPVPAAGIPGMIGREEGEPRPVTAHNIVSTTELSSNGVSQFGVEERRQFMSGNPFLPTSRGQGHANWEGGRVGQDRPPQAVSAWSSGGQYNAQPPSHFTPPVSVEDRLKNLIDNKPHAARPAPHHEEGELLVPPAPSPRGYDETVNSGYYRGSYPGPGPNPPGYSHPGQGRLHGQSVGYVPSKPSERRLGSRVDSIIDNSKAKLPPPYPKPTPSPRQQFENPAFTPDEQPVKQGVSSARPVKVGGDDLRSAWNRLYGAPEWRPASNQPSSQNPATSYYGVFTMGPTQKEKQQEHHQQQQYQQQQQQQQHQEHQHKQRKSSLDQLSTTVRISPTGQSSSTQGQQSGSNSSSFSGKNTGFSTFKPEDDDDDNADEVRDDTVDSNRDALSEQALGPSAKYPDQPGSRPSSAKQGQGSSSNRQTTDSRHDQDIARSLEQRLSVQRIGDSEKNNVFSRLNQVQNKNDEKSVFSRTNHVQNRLPPEISPRTNIPAQRHSQAEPHTQHKVHPSRLSETNTSPHVNHGFVDSDDESGQYHIGAAESIFDYASESSSRSVTPPLPPLSPDSTPRGGPEPLSKYSRSYSASNVSPPKTPDLLSSTARPGSVFDKRDLRASSSQIDMAGISRHSKKTPRVNPTPRQHHRTRTNLTRVQAHSLEDLRESGNESNLSFDVENTMLMVDPESEQFTDTDNISPKDARALRQKLQGLESVYHQVLRQAGADIPRSSFRRRWSLGSSDTSSINRGKRFRSSASHRNYSRDIKAIQRRFQKLESHVVTLARSVAHLSSELRNQTSMTHEMETVKKELRELRQQQHLHSINNSPFNNNVSDFERFRGWIPSLTNPKRVNKLTKFFGQEPPLLEIFLQKLGYERYAKNFSNEHIGMIELPYMTEDRLQSIGIPMGPRLRILQEAQLCFRQENFNIYIV